MLIIYNDSELLQITRSRDLPEDVLLLSSNKISALLLYTDFYEENLEDWEHSFLGRSSEIQENPKAINGFCYSARIPAGIVTLFAGEMADNAYTDDEFHEFLEASANLKSVWKALKGYELGRPATIAKVELPTNAFYSDNVELYGQVKSLRGILELHGIQVSFDSEGNAEWGYTNYAPLEPPKKPL